jgi:hypothetical protein
MNPTQRITFRAAMAIHEQVAHLRNECPDLTLPDIAYVECQRLSRQIHQAAERGWYRTVQPLREHLMRVLASCRSRLDELHTQLERQIPTPCCMPLREIYDDLDSLDNDFIDVTIDLAASTVSVQTDDIVLKDVRLGPFRIELDWNRLDRPRPYEVIAVDANPAATSSETTHPHVQARELCEGDGHAAIRQALRQGRLLDFFTLVAQILETYNPSSAYVSLDDWQGIDCHDCGRVMDDDDRVSCEQCETDICCDCSVGCGTCDCYCCSDCVGACAHCDDYFCPACLGECSECDESFCKECLTDGQCQSCNESDNEDAENGPDAAQSPDTTGQTSVEVHAVCVGEACIPA